MSRSTEIPFADDPLFAELRDARPEPPDDLLDPAAPANRAILEAILGATRPRRRRRALVRVATAAAVATAVAGFVVASPFGGSEPSAADVVHRAAVASGSALDSGRALVTVTSDATEDEDSHGSVDLAEFGFLGSTEDTYEYRFAGEDVAVRIVIGGRHGNAYPGERRIVDGELYWHVGDDPATPWFHQTGTGPSRSDWTGDPRSLLRTLEPRAGFEIVGDDTLDGVDVTHLRARTPAYFDPQELGLGQAMELAPGPLTGLDVWVDGDDVVRRIDVEATHRSDVEVAPTESGPAEVRTITQVTAASVRFTDIGEANTVEAPTEVCDVSVEQMADPPPPGADVC